MAIRTPTTADLFETLSEQLGPCELVRGEVNRLSPGGFIHSNFSSNVAWLLGDWARRTKLGRVLTNEAGLIVETGPDTVRGTDVAYVSYERLPKGRSPRGFLKIPPNLVVEIVGKGQGWADMVEKAGEYLRFGVDRVWIIDPDTRRLHIYRSDSEPVVLSETDTLSNETVLPGFSCRIEEFFAE